MPNAQHLEPVARCRSLQEYRQYCNSVVAERCHRADLGILALHAKDEAWTVPGWSILADREVEFAVDQLSGGVLVDGAWNPNLRERLVCPVTGLNNRQRPICTLVAQRCVPGLRLWFMEQVTPVFNWAHTALGNCEVIGSEYLGPDCPSGTEINGLRHEDCERLSFADGSLDMIVSNDVFEHVANPGQAFSECARVLKTGGQMIATIPFSMGSDKSITRAILNDRQELDHLLEPVYHGNPISEDGSLVFTDFGWNVLDEIIESGFRDCFFYIYHAPELGHYGNGLMVLWAIR